MATSRISVLCDEVDDVLKSLHALVGEQVIIGIPENSERSASGADIQNAMIAYVMEFGSPAQNIPARAFLVPGTRNALPKMVPLLKRAASFALNQNLDGARHQLELVGALGVGAVRAELFTGAFAPLQPATIAGRARARGEGRSRNEESYFAFVAGGVPAAVAQQLAGIQPLVNSGQLRDAIAYSVRVAKR
jgi:hypothetical protein